MPKFPGFFHSFECQQKVSSYNLFFDIVCHPGSTFAAVKISSTLQLSRKTEPTAPVYTGARTKDVANGATKDAGEGTQLTVVTR